MVKISAGIAISSYPDYAAPPDPETTATRRDSIAFADAGNSRSAGMAACSRWHPADRIDPEYRPFPVQPRPRRSAQPCLPDPLFGGTVDQGQPAGRPDNARINPASPPRSEIQQRVGWRDHPNRHHNTIPSARWRSGILVASAGPNAPAGICVLQPGAQRLKLLF